MKVNMKSLFMGLCLLAVGIQASDIHQILGIKDAAKSWIAKDGQPLYYTSSSSLYMVDNQATRKMPTYSPQASISLSPNAEFRLISLLQNLDEIKAGQRYSDYYVLDDQNELLYTVNRGTDSDLKPLVAAISDSGILALADPVKAMIYFYKAGNLVAEGQLYEDDGPMSMERNILMQWVDAQCYILLERPGFNGGPAGKSLFIRISADGREQSTSYLPFSHLLDKVFQSQRFFISGYDYHAADGQMLPMIVEVSPQGQVLWSNENFGHELALSANGSYLAALSSHELIQLFNLDSKRVNEIHFNNENKASLGLSVNNRGEVAVIRVAVDFFAKRNTHFSQIFFPQTKQSADIQLNPRFPKLFQIETDGDRFFIGSNYEWLEINQ